VRSDARANRDRILAAAEQVFGAEGADVSTEEVARRAGVGIGTVFRHFPTKRDLLEATVVRHFEHLIEEVDAPGAALDGVIRTLVSSGATKVALIHRLAALGAISEPVDRVSRELKQLVDGLLRRGQAAGAVRAEVTVDEVYLLIRALATVTGTTDTSTLDRAVDLILNGLSPGAGRT
jgi:AcrR family transcriptional regulator